MEVGYVYNNAILSVSERVYVLIMGDRQFIVKITSRITKTDTVTDGHYPSSTLVQLMDGDKVIWANESGREWFDEDLLRHAMEKASVYLEAIKKEEEDSKQEAPAKEETKKET